MTSSRSEPGPLTRAAMAVDPRALSDLSPVEATRAEVARRVELGERRTARLATLLRAIPGWGRNETATLDSAKAMVREAEAVGWTLAIDE